MIGAWAEDGELLAEAETRQALYALVGSLVDDRAAYIGPVEWMGPELRARADERFAEQQKALARERVRGAEDQVLALVSGLARSDAKRLLLAEIDREEGPREAVIAATVARLRVAHEVPDAPRSTHGDRVEPDRGPVPER